MQNKKGNSRLNNKDHRDAEHEFRLTGFMADDEHRQIHRRSAAEGGYQQEGALFYTVPMQSRGAFIVAGGNDSDDIDDNKVNNKKFHGNLGEII